MILKNDIVIVFDGAGKFVTVKKLKNNTNSAFLLKRKKTSEIKDSFLSSKITF